MIVGLLMLTAGGLLACLPPAQAALAWWRWHRTAAIGEILRTAVPIAPADVALDRLVAEADVALERDNLIRGIAGVTEIYDRA